MVADNAMCPNAVETAEVEDVESPLVAAPVTLAVFDVAPFGSPRRFPMLKLISLDFEGKITRINY